MTQFLEKSLGITRDIKGFKIFIIQNGGICVFGDVDLIRLFNNFDTRNFGMERRVPMEGSINNKVTN